MPNPLEVLLREREVKAVVPLSRSRRYALIRLDRFPPPVKLGERAAAWRQSEIDAWQRWRFAIAEGRADEHSHWRNFLDGSAGLSSPPSSKPSPVPNAGTTRRRGRS
jgi:prophage regulatory protein